MQENIADILSCVFQEALSTLHPDVCNGWRLCRRKCRPLKHTCNRWWSFADKSGCTTMQLDSMIDGTRSTP